MFHCELTGKLTKPGEKIHLVTTEWRDKVYYKPLFDLETGKPVLDEHRKIKMVEAGVGWEIKKQIKVSDEGLALYRKMHPEQGPFGGPVRVMNVVSELPDLGD